MDSEGAGTVGLRKTEDNQSTRYKDRLRIIDLVARGDARVPSRSRGPVFCWGWILAAIALGAPQLFGATLSFEPFTIHSSNLDLQDVAFGGDHFLASVDGTPTTYISADGRNWSKVTAEPFDGYAYGNSQWLAVGINDHVFTSTDGRSWTRGDGSNGLVDGFRALYAAAFGDGYFAAVGSEVIGTSSNGVDWWAQRIDGLYRGVAYGAGRFVAVGNIQTRGYVTTFTPSGTSVTGPDEIVLEQLRDICRSPDAFVVVGDGGTRLRSTDGLLWTQTPGDGFVDDLHGVAYGAGLFVAVGEQGSLLVSGDGLNWERLDSGIGVGLNKVAFGQGRFVVVGDDGYVLRSISVDRGCVRFGQTSVDVDETGRTARLRVVREGGKFGAAQAKIATSSRSARVGEDFDAFSQVLQWNDGQDGERIIDINILDDAEAEDLEDFAVVLTETAGVGICGPGEATVRILGPNDQPPGRLAFKDTLIEALEGVGTVRLAVGRSGGTAGAASVEYESLSGSAVAGADFGGDRSGTLTWADGDRTERMVEIPIADDELPEQTEDFTVVLRNATGASLGVSATATVRILGPNDPPVGKVAFVIPTVEVAEGIGALQIAVARTGSSSGASSVQYEALAGSATPGSDFSVASGVLSWSDGEIDEKHIPVQIIDDLLHEEGEEFTVILRDAVGAALGDQVTVTIRIMGPNDAPAGSLSFAKELIEVAETVGTVRLGVVRTGGTAGPASVKLGSVPGTAGVGSDFTVVDLTLTWADGEGGEKFVDVAILNDAEAEGTEEFTVVLSEFAGAKPVEPSRLAVRILGPNDSDVGSEVVSPGFVKAEYFWNIPGESTGDLVDAPKFQANRPDEVRILKGLNLPRNIAENYGVRVTGHIVPAKSTEYQFFLRSDDSALFYIGETPDGPDPDIESDLANAVSWCCGTFPDVPGRTAASGDIDPPVRLQAGKRYPFVLLFKEGYGGDFAEVAWRAAGDRTHPPLLRPLEGNVVEGLVLDPGYQLSFVRQPAPPAGEVHAGDQVLLESEARTEPASDLIIYQWRMGGQDIAGATGPSYRTPALAGGEHRYQVVARTLGGRQLASEEVILRVAPDERGPRLVGWSWVAPDTLLFNFDEPLHPLPLDPSQIIINPSPGPVTWVQVATERRDTLEVRLRVPLVEGRRYSAQLRHLRDSLGNVTPRENVAIDTKLSGYVSAVLSLGPLLYYRFDNDAVPIARNLGMLGTLGDADYRYLTLPDRIRQPGVGSADGFHGFGPINHALSLRTDDSSWVETRTNVLGNRTAFTLQFWMNPKQTEWLGRGNYGIFGDHDAQFAVGLTAFGNLAISSRGYTIEQVPYPFPDGEWHQVVLVKSGARLDTYLDGNRVSSNEVGDLFLQPVHPSSQLRLAGGGIFDPSGNYWVGGLDEIAIYDYDLTPDQIWSVYLAAVRGQRVAPTLVPAFVSVRHDSQDVVLEWEGDGILERAESVDGPWKEVPEARAEHREPRTNQRGYFRLRLP